MLANNVIFISFPKIMKMWRTQTTVR